MSNNTEHAVDPSTLDPETWVEIQDCRSRFVGESAVRVMHLGNWPGWRIVTVLHRADECPHAEQWRQVTPEEVRNGWLVRLTKGDQALEGRAKYGTLMVDDIVRDLWRANHGWALWTTEPADSDAEAAQALATAAAEPVEWARHVLDRLDSEWRLVRMEEGGDE